MAKSTDTVESQIPERVTWLQQTTCLGLLSEEVIVAIATQLIPLSLEANRRLILDRKSTRLNSSH